MDFWRPDEAFPEGSTKSKHYGKSLVPLGMRGEVFRESLVTSYSLVKLGIAVALQGGSCFLIRLLPLWAHPSHCALRSLPSEQSQKGAHKRLFTCVQHTCTLHMLAHDPQYCQLVPSVVSWKRRVWVGVACE